MKKHLLRWMIALAVMLPCLLTSASAASGGVIASGYCGGEGDGKNLTWTLYEDGELVIDGSGAMSDYYYNYDNNPPWASCRSSIIEVTVKDGVTSIGKDTFYYCGSLTSVDIPDSVISIGDAAFSGCSSLISVVIPDSVTSVGDEAFRYCGSLASVVIGDSVTSIGNSLFYGCISLTDVVIPERVTSIESLAFCGCSSLVSVTIPDSVTSIENQAFGQCGSLVDINVGEENTAYCSVAGVLFAKDMRTLIQCPGGMLGEYVIPDDVTNIGVAAFCDCTKLIGVTVPDSVITIEESAFYGCTSLTGVKFGDSVTDIGASAFEGCSGLEKVIVPGGVTQINAFTFANCWSLSEVTIPRSVTTIEMAAFGGCHGLEKVYYTGDVTGWCRISFEENESPMCYAKQLYISGELVAGELVIPEGVTVIPCYAFSKCALTTVTIPVTVTNIERYAFLGCGSLDEVFIPDGVTVIGGNAFARCDSLSMVVIGSSVTSIEWLAFAGCNNLKNIYFRGGAPKAHFDSFPENTTLHYPEGNYSWTEDEFYDVVEENWYGYTLKSWIPRKAYNFDSLHTGTLELYIGTGTAYYRLSDMMNRAVAGQDVSYTIGGNRCSAVTDGNGVFSVKIPVMNKTGDYYYSVSFSIQGVTENVAGAQQTLCVKVKPQTCSQEWSGSLGGSIKGSIGGGVGASVGVASFEATAAKASAKAGVNGEYALKDSYENGVRTMEATYAYDVTGGINFKSGVEATVAKTEIKVASVSAGAKYVQQSSAGVKIKGYNPGNMDHLLKLGKFNLQAALMGVNSVWAQQILDWLDVGAHNQSGYNSEVAVDAGASIGMIEVADDEEIGLAGGDVAAVLSSGGKTDFLERTKTQTAKIAHDYGVGLFSNAGALIPGAGSYIAGFQNSNSLEMEMKFDWEDELQEISYKLYDEGEKNIWWFGEVEEDSTTLSFGKEQANKIMKDDTILRRYAQGKRLFLTSLDLSTSAITATTGDYTGTTQHSHTIKNGVDLEFPFKLEALLGAEVSLSGSFIDEFSYPTKTGIIYKEQEYVSSESIVSKAMMLEKKRSLSEVLAEPMVAIANSVKDFFVSVGDAIVNGVTNAYTTVTGTVSGWFADISTAVSDIMPFRSYAILSLTEVDEPDGNAAVAVTIGDPYTVAVYTDATKQTLVSDEDLAKYPLIITMAYTGEMLTAAGAPADADINIYRFDFERNMYVCVANCVQDKESMTVTASIARQGEYILATDNASPLVSDFEVSDGTAAPTITALVSDLSGIETFAFWLDEGDVLVDSVRFADCYDPVTGLFTYKVTQPLTAGEHTAWFRATDTIGNANAEPFSFTFTVDASAPVIADVTVPEDTVTSAEGFIIAANVTDDGQLSQVMAKVTAGETVITRSMTQADGVWCVTVDGITGNVQATVEVIAVDMAGNRSQSDTFVVAIDIPEPPAGLQITAQRVGNTAEIAIGNHQRAMGGWVVAAVYDAEGRMLDMNGEYVGMKSGEVKNLSLVLDCEPERIAHGKVFFLDVSEGHEAMIPVCDFE